MPSVHSCCANSREKQQEDTDAQNPVQCFWSTGERCSKPWPQSQNRQVIIASCTGERICHSRETKGCSLCHRCWWFDPVVLVSPRNARRSVPADMQLTPSEWQVRFPMWSVSVKLNQIHWAKGEDGRRDKVIGPFQKTQSGFTKLCLMTKTRFSSMIWSAKNGSLINMQKKSKENRSWWLNRRSATSLCVMEARCTRWRWRSRLVIRINLLPIYLWILRPTNIRLCQRYKDNSQE